MRTGRCTRAVITRQRVAHVATSLRDPDWSLDGATPIKRNVLDAAGEQRRRLRRAQRLATALMGDSIATNMFMLGYAWQKGRIPLARESLERAIELNGVAVEMNQLAFVWGRRVAHDLESVASGSADSRPRAPRRRSAS